MKEHEALAHYFNKAAGFIQAKEFPQAIKALEEYICLEPREPLAYQFLGDLYLHLHNPTRALRPLKFALKLDPEQGKLYELVAQTYDALGEPDRAERYRKYADHYTNNASV